MKSLSLSTPHLIMVIGIPGAGKTFFADQFAQMFNAPLLSEDEIMHSLTDLDPLARQAAASKILRSVLPQFLKTQKTIMLDGTGSMRVERTELTKLAREAGYQTLVVWVQTDTPTAKVRSLRPPRGSNKMPLSPEVFDSLLRKFSPPHASEKYIVLSGKHTYASQAKMLLRKLSAPRAQAPAPQQQQQPVAMPKRPTGNRISIS